MPGFARGLSPLISAPRLSTAFGVVANVWFVILWTRGQGFEPGTEALRREPLWLMLLAGAVNATALFAFAATVNDVLDMKRDRTLHPDRPLPAGETALETAVLMVTSTLILAVLGASAFGNSAVIMTLLIAAALFFFTAVARFIPGIGVVLLGLIFAGQTLVPNHNLRFIVPVWLIMTQALVVAAAAHMVARKTPRISTRAAVAAIAGWVFWSALLGALGAARSGDAERVWPEWLSLAAGFWPAVAAIGFVVVAWRKVAVTGPGERAGEKVWRYGFLWLTVYGPAWLLGVGDTPGALILGILTVAGFGTMTVIREAQGLAEHPLGYRL